MKRYLLAAALVFTPLSVWANPSIPEIIDAHILPRFDALASSSEALSLAAAQDCDPPSDDLRNAYGAAFDAWVTASHLRFGPTEVDNRAFALAFWPDSRGATPRALASLIADEDPIASDPKAYADVSIAARGFYALEFLLFDETLMTAGEPTYHCMLVKTVAADIAATSTAIYSDWINNYVDIMRSPGTGFPYRNDDEILQEMLRSLFTGLQFTEESRMGRPLGTFDRPRPNRAEVRRSGRSAAHVDLSLRSLRDLASLLMPNEGQMRSDILGAFDRAQTQIAELDDPIFAGVTEQNTRIKIEIVQTSITRIRTLVITELGPTLGVVAGFNALDGD